MRMICELWSKHLKARYIGNYIGEYARGFKEDTRSVDDRSCRKPIGCP